MQIRITCCITNNLSFILTTTTIFLTFFYIFNSVIHKFTNSSPTQSFLIEGVNLPNVVVHLDLKNYPPKFSYLNNVLLKLRKLKATGLLIEYGHLFPFEGLPVNLSTKYALNKTELQDFLKKAVHFGLDIIPLVHISNISGHGLELNEMKHLKELSACSDVICSKRSNGIQSILEQVIKFHETLDIPLKYFHIGFDHSNNINTYEFESLQTNESFNTSLFVNHLKVITDYIHTVNPYTTILMWDDMVRHISIDEWENVDKLEIEVIYTDFRPKLHLSHSAMYNYREKFENIWIASAYKGIKTNTASVPNLKERFSNTLSWMKRIKNYKFVGEAEIYSFKGIILMGQSFDSRLTPYEPLPVSLPSLFLSLLLIKRFRSPNNMTKGYNITDYFDNHLQDEITGNLVCSDLVDLDHFNIDQCFFDGSDLYEILTHLDLLTDLIATMEDGSTESGERLLQDVWNLEIDITKTLSRYYDNHFVEEYVDLKLKVLKKILYKFLNFNLSHFNGTAKVIVDTEN